MAPLPPDSYHGAPTITITPPIPIVLRTQPLTPELHSCNSMNTASYKLLLQVVTVVLQDILTGN